MNTRRPGLYAPALFGGGNLVIRNSFIWLAAGTIVLAVTIACSSQSSSTGTSNPKPAAAAQAAVVPTPAMLDHGQKIYKTTCAPCHGESGKGDGPAAVAYNPKPRDHTNREYMSKLSDEDIAKVVQFGGAIKNMPLMPSSPQIKGDDLRDLIIYVRSLSGASKQAAR